jgi:hypothetical protein
VKLLNKRPYGDARRRRYAPTGDQLDAIMRGLRAVRDSGLVELPQETLDEIAAWEAVKLAIPKPEDEA